MNRDAALEVGREREPDRDTDRRDLDSRHDEAKALDRPGRHS